MWTCPKCGRSFKNQNQGHYCGKTPENIEEYIAEQPEYAQPYLREIREAIRVALPGAEERISWSMPTFWKKRNIIQFAAAKKHVGLYPGPEAVEKFSEQLKGYKTSKGAIQFPYDKPHPLELIAEIARWCYEGETNKIYGMDFSKIYQLLVNKALKKGRTKEEVDEIIRWLTGYSQADLEGMLEKTVSYGDFFRNAPEPNENRGLIKGTVCGVRVENIEEPLMREIRYLDKLIDELAKGKTMDKILRKK